MDSGLISGAMQWGFHPSNSKGTVGEWLAGLVLILIVAFLWSEVVSQID